MTNHETADPTAAIEVFARLLCSADIQVYGDEHPTWQKLSRKVQDDYRKAAAWLLPRMTVATRAAAVSGPPPAPRADDRAAVLRGAADELGRMDYDTDSSDYGYDTYRDAWNGGVMDGADLLRRLADEAQQPEPAAKPPVGYSGKGRVWCVSCPRTAGEDVPLTVDVLQPYEQCAGCGRDVVDVARAAGEQQNETPEAEPGCAHCGKTILRINGTLAEWWVHDPGGHTICFPEQAASSPRATPKPAAGVGQDVAQPEVPGHEWCKCRTCWGWFVEEHPGENLDELGRDLGWWSGLPVHRDAPAGVRQDEAQT